MTPMKIITASNLENFRQLVQEQLDLGAEVLQLLTMNDAFVALTHIRPVTLPTSANVVNLTTERIPEDKWLIYGAPAAVALGKLGKGRAKTMTPAAIQARQRTAAKRRLPAKLPDEQLPPGPLGPGYDDDED